MFTPRFCRLIVATICATFGMVNIALATAQDDFKEGSRLYQQGKIAEALSRVNSGLQQQPKDPQGRFLKGLIQTEQKKTADAIQTFTSLTEDYPELPEPYNNLAVLYAAQGNYDKAKAALELAIHTHPAYATAHENLGDIYAQLARRAYDKALQLDKSNTTALSKLALVKEMFSVPKSQQPAARAVTATPPATAAVVGSTKVPAVSASKSASNTAVATAPAAANAAVAAPAQPTASTIPAAATAATPPTAGASAATAATEEGAKLAVQSWANSWSRRDVASYLAAYAPTFETPDGMSRTAWESQRKDRISSPKSIRVDITFKSVKVTSNEAVLIFRQIYRSETVKSDNTKTIKLTRVGNRWLIQSERAGS